MTIVACVGVVDDYDDRDDNDRYGDRNERHENSICIKEMKKKKEKLKICA